MIFLVDPVYNPNFLNPSEINASTKLGPGISIAKFLGSYGNRTSFNHITSASARLSITRQLYLHAELYRSINGNTDMFNDVRLIVSEGIYRAGPTEFLGGDNIKKADGSTVVYQVIDRDGKVNHERTYEVAEYWKDYNFFEKLTLDYDTLNPDGSLTSQIVVEMPTVLGASYDVNFNMFIDTVYNGRLLSVNELIEVLEK